MNFKSPQLNDDSSYVPVREGSITAYLPGRPQSQEYRDWKVFVEKQFNEFHNSPTADQIAKFAQQFLYLQDESLAFLYDLKIELLWKLVETIDKLRDSAKVDSLMGVFKKVIAILKTEDSWKLIKDLIASPKYRRMISDLLKDLLDQNFSYHTLRDIHRLCYDHKLCEEAMFEEVLINKERNKTHLTLLKQLISDPKELNHAIKLFKKVEKDTYKLMIKWIKEENLDVNNYEFLIGNSRFETMFYYLKDFNWAIVEEMITNAIDLAIFINHLVRKKKLKEAYSVWHRLSKHHTIKPPSELKNLEHNQHYIENLMVAVDKFWPASANLNNKDEYKYLTLSKLGYSESTVTFVDRENLSTALSMLSNQTKLGLDAEFYRKDFSALSDHLLATLQVAYKTHIFVFDGIDLVDNAKFVSYVIKMLADPKIEKVGFSFCHDVDVFERSFGIKNIELNNLIDFGFDSKAQKNIGLAKLVESLFQKPMCKFERGSGWNRRPLRLSQLHYAAMDAAVTLALDDFKQAARYRRVVFTSRGDSILPPIPTSKNSKQDKKQQNANKKQEKIEKHKKGNNDKQETKSQIKSEPKRPNNHKEPQRKERNINTGSDHEEDYNNPTSKNYNNHDEKHHKKEPHYGYEKINKQQPSASGETQSHKKRWEQKPALAHQKQSIKTESDFRKNGKYQHEQFDAKDHKRKEVREWQGAYPNYDLEDKIVYQPKQEAKTENIVEKTIKGIKIFVVDTSLNSLLFRMRKFGIDTYSVSQLPVDFGNERVALILGSGNNKVSKDEFNDVYQVKDSSVIGQFSEVISRYKVQIHKKHVMTRCPRCNSNNFQQIEPTDFRAYSALIGKAPNPYADLVWKCFSCNHPYFEGMSI